MFIRLLKKSCALLISVTLFVTLAIQGFAQAGITFETSEKANNSSKKQNVVNTYLDYENIDFEDLTITDEDISLREESVKHFNTEEGIMIAVMYPEAVHYLENGSWKEIDNSVVADEKTNTFKNKDNSFSVELPNQLNNGSEISVSKNNAKLTFKLLNANAAEGKIASKASRSTDKTDVSSKIYSKLNYKNTFKDTDIAYTIKSNELKEEIILNKMPERETGYSYEINTHGLVATLYDDGSLTFSDRSTGEVFFTIYAPFMEDANGEYSDDISVTLSPTSSKNKYILTYTPAYEWLSSDDRVYPVTVDPTVTGGTGSDVMQDVTVASGYPTLNYWNQNFLRMGCEGRGINRTYMKFNQDYLPTLAAGDVLIKAELKIWRTNYNGSGYAELHNIKSTFTYNSINWNNKPDYETAVIDSCEMTAPEYYYFDVTTLVNKWYESEDNNLGFMLKYRTEESGNYATFRSAEYGTENRRPCIYFAYRNVSGLTDNPSYTVDMGSAGTAYINPFSGSLTVIRNDIGYDGNILPVSINMVFGNNIGWMTYNIGMFVKTNYHQHITLKTIGSENYIEYIDGTHSKRYFVLQQYKVGDVTKGIYVPDKYSTRITENESGIYEAEAWPSEYFETVTYNGKTHYCYHSDSGLRYMFDTDASGRLVAITDKNSENTLAGTGVTVSDNKIQIYYKNTTGYVIDCIIDGAGRIYKFIYNSGAVLYFTEIRYFGNTVADHTLITNTTEGYISKTAYTFNAVNMPLTAVGPNGNSESAISSYTSFTNGTTTFIDKDTGDRYVFTCSNNKVETVSYYSGNQQSEADETLTFEYATYRTKLTDSKGNISYMNFDSRGNLISSSDENGNGYFYDYGREYGEGSINKLTLSSRPQNQTINLLADPSFEKGTVSFSSSLGVVDYGMRSAGGRSGMYGFMITRGTDNTTLEANYNLTVPANKATVITFSAWIKTAATDVNAYIAVEMANKIVKTKSEEVSLGEWTRVKVTAEYGASSTGTETLKLYLGASGAKGIAYFDDLQVTIGDNASQRDNIISNGDFNNGITNWTGTALTVASDSDNTSDYRDANALKITGQVDAEKYASQTISGSGNAGDTITFSGWAKASSLPVSENTPLRFGILVVFNDAENDADKTAGYVSFNSYVNDWQYVYGTVTAQNNYTSIDIYLCYNYNSNTAYFDGIQAFKEKAGTIYTYNSAGYISEQTTFDDETYSYTYNEDGEVTSVTRTVKKADGTEKTQTINITKSDGDTTGIRVSADSVTTETNTVSRDAYGNTLLSRTTHTKGDTVYYTETLNEYTANGNYLTKVFDELQESHTAYNYDLSTGLLTSATDNEGNTVSYSYDSNHRVTSITAGNDSVNYEYDTEGRLSKITSLNGVEYGFDYNKYGQTTEVSVGGTVLVTNNYKDILHNGVLDNAVYGNGYKVSYEYANQDTNVAGGVENDNVTAIFVNDATDARYEFTYDSLGRLIETVDNGNNLKTNYYYNYDGDLAAMKVSSISGTGYSYNVTQTFDSENRLIKQTRVINGTVKETEYTYEDGENGDGTVTVKFVEGEGDNERTYLAHSSADAIGRNSGKTLIKQTGENAVTLLEYLFTYRSKIVGDTLLQSGIVSNFRINLPGTQFKNFSYTYDYNGNITSISDGTSTVSYVYDSLGQLIRENNGFISKTITYTYDAGGNILSKSEYAYTTAETLGTAVSVKNYGYSNNDWKDLLTSYNGQTITYDAIGNPLNYMGRTMTWEGRRLISTTKNGALIQYSYDDSGLRLSKQDSNGITRYTYDNGRIVHQYTENNNVISNELFFRYDENGAPLSVSYNGVEYFYVLNLQGDIIGIIDNTGAVVVEYSYDSWGKLIATTGTMATTLGVVNPLRYRGYYYDTDTGFYYCNSRYYDPEVGRFINVDSIIAGVGDSIQGYNMFAYCMNNPVNRFDTNGNWSMPNWLKVTIGAVATVAAVAITVATGGAVAPLLIGVAASTLSGAVTGYITGGVQGMIDGACDGFMWGGIGAFASSSIGAVKAVKTAKQGIAIGEDMSRVGKAAQVVDATTYKPMKGYNLIKKIPKIGEQLADDLSLMHNKAFINRMTKLGAPIYDTGSVGANITSRWYAMERQVVNGYFNYVKMF
ncbi:MAG: DNRLRE domain-containing protein [Clostridia bacterium]|nr:DNRLRE domain-containing protein [Clostridia bacterium]